MAHALGRPVVTGLKGLSVEDGRARCEQEVAGGRDIYLVPLPAVVTVLEGINLPRYPSVPAKLRARAEAGRAVAPRAARRRGSRSCASWSRRARASRRRSSAAAPRRRRRWSSVMREMGVAG